MRKRQSGMTLVELMIVVLVISILAGIAVPSYRSYMLRANRTEGKAALMFNAGALERCYTRFNSYLPADGCTAVFPVITQSGNYQITINTPDKSTFTLSAAPQLGQTKDTACMTLTLSNAGARGSLGGPTDPANCWGR